MTDTSTQTTARTAVITKVTERWEYGAETILRHWHGNREDVQGLADWIAAGWSGEPRDSDLAAARAIASAVLLNCEATSGWRTYKATQVRRADGGCNGGRCAACTQGLPCVETVGAPER